MGSTAFQRLLLVPETTPGTMPGSGWEAWRGMGQLQDDRAIGNVKDSVGVALPALRTFQSSRVMSLGMDSAPASYEQLRHLLAAGVSAVSSAGDGAGSGTVYSYNYGTSTVASTTTYSLASGDDLAADIWVAKYGYVSQFSLSGQKNEPVTMEATWGARGPYVGTSNGGLNAWPSTTIPNVNTIIANKGSFAIDAVGGTLGDTTVSGLVHNWQLSVNSGWKHYHTVDQITDMTSDDPEDALQFAGLTFSREDWNAELTVTYEHNSSITAQRDAFFNSTPQQFQLRTFGQALDTSGTYYYDTLEINFAGFYSSWEALSDSDGNSTVQATIQIGYDPTAALALGFKIVQD